VLKKTITYEDFNGEERSEDFFFHLSKAELVELEMSHQGGLSEALKRIVAAEDAKSIIAEFKNIILSAYGQRSEDGRRFTKNQTLRDEFESTEAYSVLFMELMTDTGAAVEFINSVIPAGMAEEAAKVAAGESQKPVLEVAPTPEPQKVTRAQMTEMSQEEFRELGAKLASGEAVLVD
jgi:hypothetical protein